MNVVGYNAADLHQNVRTALCALFSKDSELLRRDANERSITHKLAEHLQTQFEHLDVDCEYNRHGDDVKRLAAMLPPDDTRTDCTDAKTVYPDIIVHKRGCDGSNALVIEVKKSNGGDTSRDKRKLRMFTSSLNADEFRYRYSLGMLLVFDVGSRTLGHAECYRAGIKKSHCWDCENLVAEVRRLNRHAAAQTRRSRRPTT